MATLYPSNCAMSSLQVICASSLLCVTCCWSHPPGCLRPAAGAVSSRGEGRFPCRWSSVGAAGTSEMAVVRQSSPGWITEATCCQQPPLCRCVPVKASAWQQACDLAPNTTPCREARPGVTEPLTGCSPSFHHPLVFASPFSVRFAPSRSHLQPFLQQPFGAVFSFMLQNWNKFISIRRHGDLITFQHVAHLSWKQGEWKSTIRIRVESCCSNCSSRRLQVLDKDPNDSQQTALVGEEKDSSVHKNSSSSEF